MNATPPLYIHREFVLAADVNHVARGLFKARLANEMARLLAHNDTPDIRGKLLVGSTAQHFAVKIVV